MTSLFSPFDLSFFYSHLWISILFFSTFLGFSLKISCVHSIFGLLVEKMESFFNSLNPSPFNKFFCVKNLFLMNLVFFLNFSGVWPYSFALTSQVSFVIYLSLSFWLSLMIFFFLSNIKGILSHMVPDGTPIPLTWFLFAIELVSNVIRPMTLTVRLVANILAGHLLMILLFQLVEMVPFCFLLYLGLNLVEIFVSMIQSYIFVTMIALYFSELE